MNNTTTALLALPPPRLTLIEEFRTANPTPQVGVRLRRKFLTALDYNVTLGSDFFRRRDVSLVAEWQDFTQRVGHTMILKEALR